MNFIILRAASATSSADQLIRVCIPIGCYNSMHTLLANQKTESFCTQSGATCAMDNKIHSGLSLLHTCESHNTNPLYVSGPLTSKKIIFLMGLSFKEANIHSKALKLING